MAHNLALLVFGAVWLLFQVKLAATDGDGYDVNYPEDEVLHHANQALRWNAKIGSCGVEQQVRVGETYAFPAFPPGHDGYANHFRGHNRPRHCNWKFETYDDCTLHFHTSHFSRGSVRNCYSQYHEISDGDRTERICGIHSPPRIFRARGKELTLTHYDRDGGGNAGSSIRGYVRCTQNNGSTTVYGHVDPPKESYNHSANYSMVGTVCNETGTGPRPVCNNTHTTTCTSESCCQAATQLRIVHEREEMLSSDFNNGRSNCTMIADICTVTSPVNQRLPRLTPARTVANDTNGYCDSIQLTCPLTTPSCTFDVFVKLTNSGTGTRNNIVCPAPPGEVCTIQATHCFFFTEGG